MKNGLVFCLFLAVHVVQAALLAGWEVSGIDLDDGLGIETNISPYTFFATTTEVEHVQARLELGEGVLPSTAVNEYGFKIPADQTSSNLAAAIEKKQYIECSIKVDDGYALNLDSIEMHGQASPLGCSNVVLMSSIDGFVAGQEMATAFPANKTGGFDTDSSGFGAPIDLTNEKYQNLKGEIIFRIYGWNSTSGSSPTYIRNLSAEDFILFGTLVSEGTSATPALSILQDGSNFSVSVSFEKPPSENYLLQHCSNLTSGTWSTVSSPFSSNSNWQVATTNLAGFYRVTEQ
jgi:hypothetical protein